MRLPPWCGSSWLPYCKFLGHVWLLVSPVSAAVSPSHFCSPIFHKQYILLYYIPFAQDFMHLAFRTLAPHTLASRVFSDCSWDFFLLDWVCECFLNIFLFLRVVSDMLILSWTRIEKSEMAQGTSGPLCHLSFFNSPTSQPPLFPHPLLPASLSTFFLYLRLSFPLAFPRPPQLIFAEKAVPD